MTTEARSAQRANGLTDEQEDFVRAIRDFCAKEFTLDKLHGMGVEDDHHSDDVARKFAELGWWGVTIPEEYGGSGGTFFDATLFLEETARGRAPIGAYGVTLIVVGALNEIWRGAPKERPPSEGRQGGVLAIAMSEPEAGSDVGGSQDPRQARGRRVGDQRVKDVVLVRPPREPRADRLPQRGER